MPANDLTMYALFGPQPFVNEISLSDFRLYPNPAQDIVELSSGVPIEAIFIYDLTGRLIFKTEGIHVYDYQMDVSGFNSGIYLLKVQSKNDYHTSRFQIVN
jgi:hypothetical protein